jgi:acetoin utilization deacetylase AcuC-like enzyme
VIEKALKDLEVPIDYRSLKNDKEFALTLLSIHSGPYIQFMTRTTDMTKPQAVPESFRYGGQLRYPVKHMAPELACGFFSSDDAAVWTKHVFASATASAYSAFLAARYAGSTGDLAIAITRPGHHAGRDMAAGYCFLNNAVVAARTISPFSDRTLIIDIDFHSASGTQQLLADMPEFGLLNFCGDPDTTYPYFSGRPGDSLHGNIRNVPMTVGKEGNASLTVEEISKVSPKTIVVSAGFDAGKNDPEGSFDYDESDFFHIGQAIAKHNVPTVIVLEGGYNLSTLGKYFVAFLSAFRKDKS